MTADYRLTAFSVGGSEVKRASLERAWLASLRACGFELRTADVGESVLVTVCTLTRVELARVNDHARPLRCCDDVDELLRWAGESSYYNPWFVVEGADID